MVTSATPRGQSQIKAWVNYHVTSVTWVYVIHRKTTFLLRACWEQFILVIWTRLINETPWKASCKHSYSILRAWPKFICQLVCVCVCVCVWYDTAFSVTYDPPKLLLIRWLQKKKITYLKLLKGNFFRNVYFPWNVLLLQGKWWMS